jgi:ribosomal protein L2
MPQINYNLSYLRLGFIAGFQFIPYKNKLISLFYFANGAVTYYLTAEPHELFSFYLLTTSYKKYKKFKFNKIILMLFQIKKLSFVSCLEIKEGKKAQYVRSSGTKAKIIKFDKDKRTVLLELPSKVRKLFSYFSFALLGKISMSLHSRSMNTKSGY